MTERGLKRNDETGKQMKIKFSLFLYDAAIFALIDLLLYVLYQGGGALSALEVLEQSALAFLSIFGVRHVTQVYRQIWRYGGIQCYIRLLASDALAGLIYLTLETLLPVEKIAFARLLAFCCMNLLGALSIRMLYRYAYKCGSQDNWRGRLLRLLLKIGSAGRVVTEADPDSRKIRIAIIGAGNVGVSLAEDLWSNPKAKYIPRCFIDSDPQKVGRSIHGVTVMSENEATMEVLREHHIQEVVFAVPSMPRAQRVELVEMYQQAGFKIKVYDFPTMEIPGKRR